MAKYLPILAITFTFLGILQCYANDDDSRKARTNGCCNIHNYHYKLAILNVLLSIDDAVMWSLIVLSRLYMQVYIVLLDPSLESTKDVALEFLAKVVEGRWCFHRWEISLTVLNIALNFLSELFSDSEGNFVLFVSLLILGHLQNLLFTFTRTWSRGLQLD